MKKLFIKIITLVIAISMVAAFAAGCNKDEKTVIGEAETYISLKINPEVELTVDENGYVTSVNPLNADAEILLSDMDLEGETIDQAAEDFVDAATEAGYIDVEGSEEVNEVEVTVVDEDNQECDRIKTMLAERVRKYFNNNGINGKVSQATLDMYAEQAGKLGVSTGKMKMILRAIDLNPEMTLEELAAMPVKDLVRLLKKNHKEDNIGYAARQEIKTAREQLRTEYAAMFTLGDEIDGIKAQLENFTGTEEEKAVIEAALAEKQAQFETMHNEYKSDLATLMADAKAKRETVRNQRRSEKQQRINNNKAKYENHFGNSTGDKKSNG